MDNISHSFCLWPKCFMTMTQGHICKVKVTVHNTPNQNPGHYSSLPCWIWIIFHTIVVHVRPKVISLRSRSHLAYGTYQKWGLDLNSLLPCWIWIIFYTIVFPDPRVWLDLDPKSYLRGQGHRCTHIAKNFGKICVGVGVGVYNYEIYYRPTNPNFVCKVSRNM